jgi:hypothetical protein
MGNVQELLVSFASCDRQLLVQLAIHNRQQTADNRLPKVNRFSEWVSEGQIHKQARFAVSLVNG